MSKPQIKLCTVEEVNALDVVRAHFGSDSDAEAFRQALRVLAKLLALPRRTKLLVVDRTGDIELPALPRPELVEGRLALGDRLDKARRWTVTMSAENERWLARVKAWARVQSEREAYAVTLLVMAQLIGQLGRGWKAWAKSRKGDCTWTVI